VTTSRGSSVGLSVREYTPSDEDAVLELLRASLGGGPTGVRSSAFFRWKHVWNPFGPTFMLVAEEGGAIVGLRAFLRWEFTAEGNTFRAVRAVDTATHPAHQGRGIFKRLTLEAIDALDGDADLVFNTPNAQSLPGYLKMGWTMVGRLPVWIRVRRPVRFARGVRHLDETSAVDVLPVPPDAPSVLQDETAIAELLAGLDAPADRLSTRRSPEYLRWRYGSGSGLGYRTVADVDGDGRLRGLAIYRARPRGPLREATLAEVIAPRAARADIARLLRRVAREADVDHVAFHPTPGSAAALAAACSGFARAPGGMTFVARPLRPGIRPEPTSKGAWALSLGDVEVF